MPDEPPAHSPAGESDLIAAYRQGDALRCAIAHHNFASDLAQDDGPEAVIVAHLVVSLLLLERLASQQFDQVARNLARFSLTSAPPAADDLRQVIGATEGLAWEPLWARLGTPPPPPLGDAIQTVWARARALQRRFEAQAVALPPSIQEALESGDRTAILAALEELPAHEIEQVMHHLHARGVIDDQALAILQTLRALAALVRYVALLAAEPERDREPVERVLADMERTGWHLRSVVHRLWEGERDAELLCAGLPPHEAALIRRMVALIRKREAE